jgi:uncharacterized membrane protein YfcA
MTQILLTVVFGVLVGLSLGLVGGGGSILTVPILVYALGESVHLATGTALAIVGAQPGTPKEKNHDHRQGRGTDHI